MHVFNKIFSSLLLLSLIGCGGDSLSLLPTLDSFKQESEPVQNKIDMIWVIDNSGSMAPSQQALADNFESFIQDFVNKAFDFKIAVVTTEAFIKRYPALTSYPDDIAEFRDGNPTDGPSGYAVISSDLMTSGGMSQQDLVDLFVLNIKQGTAGVGDERGMESLIAALNEPANDGFLREDADLAVIFVTDEEDFSASGTPDIPTYIYLGPQWSSVDYDTAGKANFPYYNETEPLASNDENYWLTPTSEIHNAIFAAKGVDPSAADSGISVHSVAIHDQECRTALGGAGRTLAQRYAELSALSDGLSLSLCDDFAASLDLLSVDIIGKTTEFFLKKTPIVSTLKVSVDNVLLAQSPTEGWTYNAEENSVIFHGAGVPQAESNVSVAFTPTSL